ncbi:hypothetical protein NXW77_19860 [Bacteroides fragilis]|nr:hypothetical protein [Bacteroides fragilis]
MERVDIKDISGSIRFSTIVNEGSKRKFLLMKEDYVTVKFNLDEPIFFKLGDYIDDGYLGVFEICDIQKPAYNAITASYDYELRLDAYYWKWKNKIFKYTPETAGQEASWNLTAPLDVQVGIVLRNLKALGYTYKGQDFVFSIDSTVENKAQLMSYDNINILDACFEMAKKWDCECWVTENIIHFGRCEFGDPVNWEIGVNVEEMTRTDSQSAYATRIYAFGSTRNIPSNYRPVDESVVVNGVVQRRLMLPAGTPYIDAYPNMVTEEAIEQVIVFDDIYPRRTGTMSDIAIHKYTDKIENADGTITEEKWDAYRFKDTGITFSKAYVLAGEELKITFHSGKLNGMMFGVIFNPDGEPEKLSDGSWNPAAQVWEIVRNEDYGRKLPGDVLIPTNGDTYVLTGWDSTKITQLGLVSAAEVELKTETEKYVAKSKMDPSTYNCKMMSGDAYGEDGVHNLYSAGQKVKLINKAYFEDGRQSRVIGFEHNLDYPFDSPIFTVGETTAYSRIGELEEKLDSLTLKGQTYNGGGSGVYIIGTNDSTPPSNRNVFSASKSLATHLRKDMPDTAKETVTFSKGLIVGDTAASIDENGNVEVESVTARTKVKAATLEVTGSTNVGTLHSEGNISTGADVWAKGDTHTLNLLVQALAKTYDLNVEHVATLFQTIVKDYISSERFIPGLMGEGMKLYKAINGDWNLEIDNAVVRKAMTIFELIISKVRAVNGGLVISSANGRVKSVSETSGDPAYYVLGIEGDMMFVTDDLVRCQVYTSGHVKYYWVPVASVNDDSILILKSVFPNGTTPAVGDDLVQMGNLTNPNRQGILYLTASEDGKPRISVLDGVNSTSLAGKSKVILGCLDGMTDTDFPADFQPSGHGLYAINCFLKGIFILRNGKSIEQEFSNIATELAAIPGKIELAIRSMKVADVNLLYDSNHKLNANPYQMGAYKYDVHLEAGKTYTLTVCYKCADSDVIRAYNNPSYGWIGTLPKSAEETVLSQPITPINPDGAYFYFYKFPQQESTETYIKWAVITEGSVGVANWIPSATERKLNIGGENLMLQSQQALDGSGAQYAFQLSKAWTDLKGKTLTISFDYAYSNLKMGSSQRFGLEKAIYKSGTSQYYYIGAFKYVDSTSPTADKGRYVHTIKVPEDIEDSLDTDIIAYIQLGAGSVCRINNFQIEIGDTATGWKPAPDDTLIESKKYTDTQILAVDGKIELSVKTKVENLGIGANNLYSYTSSPLNQMSSESMTITRLISEHGFHLVGAKGGQSFVRIPNVIPPIPGKYTVSGWIKGSQNTPVGFRFDICDSEPYIVRSNAQNTWSYFKHTFDVTNNTEEQSGIYNFVDIQEISWAYIYVKDFKVEAGEIATAWSPNFQDAVYKGAEYTNSQISVVEGKITSTVEKINTVDGRVTGLASRIEQTEKSITSVVGDIGVINSTTNRHISKRIDLRGWDNNKFFPLVISIPVYHKTRVEISRPLDAGYGKPSYGTHDGGFSMNLTFEMSGSGWGSLPAVTNIFDYTKAWTSAGAKIVVDLGQITETSTCRMGIRGGSMYDVTVDDTIDPNVINVYQTDYHGSYNTSFPVRTDGTEPVRTYGYYTEIKQTQESIALTANKVDDQGRRLSAAELTLSSDHAKLSVVEQTANSANSLAGTANNKAEAADGRVTATQNGLVETGINITSRKIVLKSDNVLFQNNAGQQTAAINANGKLSANVIEAAEVVAQAFSAQRITTGNLTVTDGAKIGAWNISGGSLVSASNSQAKILLNMSGNKFLRINEEGDSPTTSRTALMSIRNDNYSGLSIESYGSSGFALRCLANAGTANSIESYGSHIFAQRGGEKWNAPGMLCTGYVYQAGTVTNEWGNGCTLTSAQKIATGKYRIYHSLKHLQYAVLVQGLGGYGWVFGQVETQNNSYFEVLMLDANNGPRDCPFRVFVVGRNVW